MKLGLMSDTHGRVPNAARAIDSLLAAGAGHILHLGDIGDGHDPYDGKAVLDCLAELPLINPPVPCHLVAGNNDHNEFDLREYAKNLGLHLVPQGHILDLGGIRVGMTHGHKGPPLLALEKAGVDLICTGHTHEHHVTTIQGPNGKSILWVNPGALFRTRAASVAIVELPTLRVQQYTI